MSTENELFQEANSSSDDEHLMIDEDVYGTDELESQFTKKYSISSEETVSAKRVYVLSLASNKQFNKIAAGMSNGLVQLFDIQSGNHLDRIYPITPSAKSSAICGLKFLDENSLLIGKTNGKILLYDLRTNKKVETFEDASQDETKPILCFDVNANERIICAGTEQILHDSFILFFDIRKKNILGGYWESHQDDITSVKFHPKNSDLLMTGSIDGLINQFDISQKTEDDAIQMTLNTNSSVHRLNWHKNVYNKDIISCITHTNDLQIFDAEGDLISNFERSKISSALGIKLDDCDLINCHSLNDDSVFVLGTGGISNKGKILRSLNILNKNLIPSASFEENKQIVRDSIYDEKSQNLITSGEKGIITIWTSNNIQKNDDKTSLSLKIKTKDDNKLHKKKPY